MGEIDIIAERDCVLHLLKLKIAHMIKLVNTCMFLFDEIEIMDGNLESLKNCFY